MQQSLNSAINPNNEKTQKRIDGSIYLMKNIQRPGILVECGFMSNAAEAGAVTNRYTSAAAFRRHRIRVFTKQRREEAGMKAKTMFYCTECGNETPKWAGRCSAHAARGIPSWSSRWKSGPPEKQKIY